MMQTISDEEENNNKKKKKKLNMEFSFCMAQSSFTSLHFTKSEKSSQNSVCGEVRKEGCLLVFVHTQKPRPMLGATPTEIRKQTIISMFFNPIKVFHVLFCLNCL